jgi:hypothetical protein
VDKSCNEHIYNLLTSDADTLVQDDIIRYVYHRTAFFPRDLLAFFEAVGVDITKETEIFHYPISDDQIIIQGWYDLVGRQLHGERLSFWEDCIFGTTNIFFENNARHAMRQAFSGHVTFRIEFVIVIEKSQIV